MLPTTVNPYLMLPHVKYFSELYYDETPLLIPFDDLFKASSKVIFFTYVKRIRMDVGKCTIRRYTIPEGEESGGPAPEAAPEMEIRFIGPRDVLAEIIKNKAVKTNDINRLIKATSWTGMLDLAKQLADLSVELMKILFEYGINLNGYAYMKELGLIKEEFKPYENALKVVVRYDERVIELAKKVC